MTSSPHADTLLSQLRTLCKGRPVSEAQLRAFVIALGEEVLDLHGDAKARTLAFLKEQDEVAWLRFFCRQDFNSAAELITEVERARTART